jgi:integrase
MWAAAVELDPVGGRRRRKVLYARTKPELLRKLRAAQDRVEEGRPILSGRRTTGDFLAYWVSEILPGTVTDSTLQGYRHVVRRDITPYVGHVPLAQLGPEHVHVMMRALEQQRGLSPRTVAYARAVLRRALRLAERWDMVTRNAAALVDPPRQRRRQPDHLALEDVRRILAAAPDDRLGALYVLLVTCGLRRGEALALLWEDVDLDSGVVHVRAGLKRIAGQGLVRDEPKTARSRRLVPLPQVTVDLLRGHRRRSREDALARGRGWSGQDYVFTSVAGTPIDPSNLTGLWHQFCVTAGVGRVRLHALRHTAATVMLTHGVPLAVISKTLGHAGLAVTADIYADVVPELQRCAADAMQRAVDV